MFVRMAKFEGANPETRDERMTRLRESIEAVKSGNPPEEVPSEAAEVLRSSIDRVLGLVDRDGNEANAVFCRTEEDLRRVDEILNSMSPGEGDGRRTELSHYEVLLEVEL
jgi:hypothetical protein